MTLNRKQEVGLPRITEEMLCRGNYYQANMGHLQVKAEARGRPSQRIPREFSCTENQAVSLWLPLWRRYLRSWDQFT